MPFIKKNNSQDAQPSSPFIGRTDEILFFVHNILQPETPTYNILSISGQGGVGKSTLLARFMAEAGEPPWKDYCLTASVDKRQVTAITMMEKLAQQLPFTGKFAKALKEYKEVLQKRQIDRETLRDRLFERIPDVAGAVVEGIPMAGPLLREGTKAAASHLLKEYQTSQTQQARELLEIPIDDLTRAFVAELNRLADTNVTFSSTGQKREQHIVLFFDTFEQLATEATPWLLDHFLEAQVSSNVVLVVAGRDPIDRTSPDNPKRWLPYCDDGTLYRISLKNFTEDETHTYLVKRGITDVDQITNMWHLSRGLPLYLSLLTSNPHGDVDPTKDVVINFLCWIPEQEEIKRQLALDGALFSMPFNQDDLEVFSYVQESDRASLYRWLTEQPFVQSRSQDGRYLYHDIVRELFSRHQQQHSQKHYYEIRRALATSYQGLLDKMQAEQGKEVYHSSEWLELLLAAVSQLLLLPDQASQIKAIERILHAYNYINKDQDREIVRALRALYQEPSSRHISPARRSFATQLLHYLEARGQVSQEGLTVTGTLLEKIAHAPSFPSELLGDIYHTRMLCFCSLKDYSQAIDAGNCALAVYEQAITLNPKVAAFYSGRGDVYRLLHYNYEEVIAGREPPSSIDADLYYRRGDAYQRLVEDYERAIADYNQAIQLEPNANRYHHRGIAHYILEQYEQAIADYDQAEALDPNDAGLYHNRGNAHYNRRQYERAIADYSQAILLKPSASRYHNRGFIHYRLGQYEQAIADYNQAITLHPNEADIYGNRARVYRRLNEYEQALTDHSRAIELAPSKDWLYASRGLTYIWLKDINQARTDYTRSWELNPTNIYSGWMIEWLRMCQERHDLAMAQRLENIAAAHLEHYTTCVCRAVALWIRGHIKDALTELEPARSLDMELWDVYFWEAMIRASLGQEDEAVAVLKKALRIHLAPMLLSPLHWLEQTNLDFYENSVLPLLAEYGV